MPLLNGVVIGALGNAYFSARVLNAVFGLASLGMVFVLVWRTAGAGGAGPWMGILGVSLITFNPATVFMDGRALNHTAPMLVSLLGYAAFLRAGRSRFALRWIVLSGVAVGLASGLRLNFVVTGLPFLLVLWAMPWARDWRSKLKDSLAFGLGIGAALIPAAGLFLAAPERAFYGNLTYIRLNTTYRVGLLYDEAMTLGQKLEYFGQNFLSNPASLLLYLAVLGLGGLTLWKAIRSRGQESKAEILAFGLGAVLLAAAFSPTPLWAQYFYGPLPYLVMAVLMALARGQKWKTRAVKVAGLGFILALAFNPWGQTAQDLASLGQPAKWVPVEVAKLSNELGARVKSGKVLTLAPIFPLQAGLDIYPVFVPGPFSWRTAPILSPEKRQRLGLVAPKDLDTFLAQDPPSAILTGPEKNYEGFSPNDWQGLEKPFIQYAEANGYSPHVLACALFEDCTLWLRP
jgi:hypothetical protein